MKFLKFQLEDFWPWGKIFQENFHCDFPLRTSSDDFEEEKNF